MSDDAGVIQQQKGGVPFAQVPDGLINDKRVSGDGVRLWAAIQRRAGTKGHAWPGQKRLAEQLAVSERTIRRLVAELRDYGWLHVERQVISGRLAGNIYTVIWDTDDRTDLAGRDRTDLAGRDRTDLASPIRNESQREREKSTTPLTPRLAAGGDDPIQTVYDVWVIACGKNANTRLDPKRRRVIAQRLKDGFTIAELCEAVQGWKHSPWHRGENPERRVYNDIGLLLRDAAHAEQFRDLWRSPNPETSAVARLRSEDLSAEDRRRLGFTPRDEVPA